MANENRSNPYAVFVVATLALGWAWAPLSGAQEVADEVKGSGMVAWHGCWQPEEADAVPSIIEGASHTLCIDSGMGANSIRLRAMTDGKVVAEEELIADGERRSFDEDECNGWKRAMLSGDRQRVYLQSETTCGRGNTSYLSGAMQVLDRSRWIDINVMRVADQREVTVRRYQAQAHEVEPHILQTATPTAELTARIVAAARLDADDVIEALEVLDPSVVEALLVETGSSFPMNSDLLLRLDNAGVPSQIIDLMVALSYPDHFNVEDERYAAPAVVQDRYWDPWRFGYGYNYHYWYWYHREWNDPVPPGSGRSIKGRAISGRGYTRVRVVDPASAGPSSTTGASSQGSSSPSAGSGSGSSTSTTSSSGYSGSGSSKGKAVPR